jgi:hypothetical protein
MQVVITAVAEDGTVGQFDLTVNVTQAGVLIANLDVTETT